MARPILSNGKTTTTLYNRLKKLEKNKPASYTSNYGDQITAKLNEYNNRKFDYNFDQDKVYQNYKQQYQKMGKTAMQDTTAQAAALTGGYGNSYGVTAGNQAYQSYLTQLNDIIPQLEETAYSRYENEGNQLLNTISQLKDQEQTDYSKYRDKISDYDTQRNYLYGKLTDSQANDLNRYNIKNTNYENDRTYAASKASASKSSGGSSSSSSSSTKSLTTKQVASSIPTDIKKKFEKATSDEDRVELLRKYLTSKNGILTGAQAKYLDGLYDLGYDFSVKKDETQGVKSKLDKKNISYMSMAEFARRIPYERNLQQYGSYLSYLKSLR